MFQKNISSHMMKYFIAIINDVYKERKGNDINNVYNMLD